MIKTWLERLADTSDEAIITNQSIKFAMQDEIDELREKLTDIESREPVAWMLGHRLYDSLKDAEFDWRHDSAFDDTGYIPVPLFTKEQL